MTIRNKEAFFWQLWCFVLLLMMIFVSCGRAAVSIIEIPLKMERVWLQRIPGQMEFVYVGWIQTGKKIAIPESEIGRFLLLAKTLDTPEVVNPGGVVGNVAILRMEVEHTAEIAWFFDDGTIFASWDPDNVPPPQIAVNGQAVEFWTVGSIFPKAPRSIEAKGQP